MKKMFTALRPLGRAPLKQYLLTLSLLAGCSGIAVAQAPVNDDCDNAIDLSDGALLIDQTNDGATTGGPALDCDGQPVTPDIWYKVHSGNGTGDITVTVDAGFGFALISKQYFDGDCGSLSSAGCFFGDLVISPTPNTTYYFRLSELNSGTVSFTIQASGNIAVPVLPVTMSKLEAKVTDNHTALDWTTFTEQNNYGFDIERSADSRNFRKIGFVPTQAAQGNSAWKLSYAFTDITAAGGVAYYRLLQTDKDGKTTYSNIVKVNNDHNGSAQPELYPNPANDRLHIALHRPAGSNTRLAITDVTGKTVWSSTTGAAGYDLDLRLFTPGMYLLRCAAGGATTVQKFIKE